eukprot:scaffold4261_cov110-Isochrysis_galbana.AAC.5
MSPRCLEASLLTTSTSINLWLLHNGGKSQLGSGDSSRLPGNFDEPIDVQAPQTTPTGRAALIAARSGASPRASASSREKHLTPHAPLRCRCAVVQIIF